MSENAATGHTPNRPRSAEVVGRAVENVRAGAPVHGAAALSLSAALIHLWAMPEHFAEWWGYGAFFLAAALAQGVFGVAVLRYPAGLLALAGILDNLFVAGLYLMTRTLGVPLGPLAGAVEEAELLDVAATAAEVGTIVALVALLEERHRRLVVNALLLLGLAAWAFRLTGILP